MPIELKMPALSPTMEEGTVAKWLVAEGDSVRSGDLLAEIETDKATMEFEAVDEGVVSKLVIAAGTDGVKVGTVIALMTGEDEGGASAPAPKGATGDKEPPIEEKGYGASPADDVAITAAGAPASPPAAPSPAAPREGVRVISSPLAKRLAGEKGVDLAALTGSGPGGRIVKADVEGAQAGAPPAAKPEQRLAGEVPFPTAGGRPTPAAADPGPPPKQGSVSDIPHEVVKLSNMRKTIARRLTESKATIPHIYLAVDIRLDALLKLRGELNASLAARGVKLSVNDMLIKALALALVEVPACNVSFQGDTLLQFARADIAVAVSIPGGLITPIVTGADAKAISAISREMTDLAARAKDGKLAPHEYQGGTASISNMGMFGIKAFDAVINPPQAMIMAIGAGERRPYLVDDAVGIATVMSATGSFDHRAIDGADGAALMQAFKGLCEAPLGLVA